MPSDPSVKTWQPARFTIGTHTRPTTNPSSENLYAVLILNQPLEQRELLIEVCSKATFTVCADGGANRLRELSFEGDEKTIVNVDYICGDLDSIRPEVLAHYEQKGVKVLKIEDQDSTDMEKCLKVIAQRAETTNDCSVEQSKPHLDVAVLGSLGGRADQAFSQLHQLYLAASTLSPPGSGDLYLLTPESVIFVLEPGLNRISTPVGLSFFTENVGIIPIARPSVITTRGLEWDVTDWPTAFGTQMSTSNHIKADVVEVETTERVLFTLEIAKKPEGC